MMTSYVPYLFVSKKKQLLKLASKVETDMLEIILSHL